MQQKHPGRTLILWIIAAHLFMGMVAYEWLPVSFRGSWIFILGEFKHEVRQFQKPYDNQQAEQISLMV